MKIEAGRLDGQLALPRFLVSLHQPRQCDTPFFTIGRLYGGYVGLMWITRLFYLTVWLHKEAK